MKIFKIIALIVALIGIAYSSWYYRPWSDYSPAKLANLLAEDSLVDNFRNMKDLIPSQTVSHGTQTSELEYAPTPLNLNYQFDGQTKNLETFLEESTTTGLMVIKNGKVVFENYYQEADETSLFTSWSVAKSFVVTAIAMAVKEGRIQSLDDKAEKYAPQYSGSAFGGSSLKSLIAMSTGIDFDEDYASDDGDIRPFFFNSFVLKQNPDGLLLPFKTSRAPFNDFHYISPNSHVLSAVLRGVYQKPLVDIISEKIWKPLGMEADANWQRNRDDEQGIALGYCCLNARLRDYARFGKFYLDAFNNKGVGTELLPTGWAKAMPKPASAVHAAGGKNYSGRGYSQHFWLPIDEPGVFFAAGVYGQFIWVDTNRDLVITRTSADPLWTPRYPESEAVMKAIARAYD
jgi:CubicO group peptidase (beta-lactamase class C family)